MSQRHALREDGLYRLGVAPNFSLRGLSVAAVVWSYVLLLAVIPVTVSGFPVMSAVVVGGVSV